MGEEALIHEVVTKYDITAEKDIGKINVALSTIGIDSFSSRIPKVIRYCGNVIMNMTIEFNIKGRETLMK